MSTPPFPEPLAAGPRSRRTVRLALFVALALVVSSILIALFTPARDLLLWKPMWHQYWTPDGRVAGWYETRRFGDRRSRDCCYWYIETGFRHRSFSHRDRASTTWDARGKVIDQSIASVWIEGPPWEVGVRDLEFPDAPWISRGIPFREWWAGIDP